MNHPRQHLWQALQRRFGDQNKPTTAAELLVRGLKIVPLDGQENSAVYALGFLEAGAVRRTWQKARAALAPVARTSCCSTSRKWRSRGGPLAFASRWCIGVSGGVGTSSSKPWVDRVGCGRSSRALWRGNVSGTCSKARSLPSRPPAGTLPCCTRKVDGIKAKPRWPAIAPHFVKPAGVRV